MGEPTRGERLGANTRITYALETNRPMKPPLAILTLFLFIGCASTPPTDLEQLHLDLTAKEGTAHYDQWSPASQRKWERAFEATIYSQ